ncbi:MAG: MerR family transcriptional regulator [Chloroflexota bacterium]
MRISELARRAGIAPSAVRWYEQTGVLPGARRGPNGYRDYEESDLARLRLVVSLRRLGLAPADAGRLSELFLERRAVDVDLVPLVAAQRRAIARRRDDLARLEEELTDLESSIAAAGRTRDRAEEGPMPQPIRVLFVCTGNSARSQIAEALLERFGGADFAVDSAGTEPKGVNPYSIRVLDEIGIDWSGATSKSLEGFLGHAFDYVITVCDRAKQACPVFPGPGNTLHWGLEDPAEATGTDEERMDAFRRTRMELTQRLRPFIEIARQTAGVPAAAADEVAAG